MKNAIARERDELRKVCAEAYQMAGALGAPVKALDNLSAAASGKPIPHETFLPVWSERMNGRQELKKRITEWLFSPKWTDTHTEFDEVEALTDMVEKEIANSGRWTDFTKPCPKEQPKR